MGLLSVREATRRCRKNPETIRRWIWDGKLQATKLGNQLFVEEGELKKLNPPVTPPTAEQIEEQLRLLDRIAELRRAIYERHGDIDVVQWLEESRASHP